MRITLATRMYALSLLTVGACVAALATLLWTTVGPPPLPRPPPWERTGPSPELRPPLQVPPWERPGPPPELRPPLQVPPWEQPSPPPELRPPPPILLEGPPLPVGPLWLAAGTLGLALLAAAFLVARSLARPLQRLGEAARALGGGDLEARTGIVRADELGDLARAFDDMAARVAALVRGQRELLANVSHELRTPLSRIRVGLDLVREGAGDAKLLADLETDLLEVNDLVEDVLTAARLDPAHLGALPRAGGLPMETAPVSMAWLLDQARQRFARAWPAHTLALHGDRDPVVQGDGRLLLRVLDNLLDNAGKYSPPGPVSVTVAAHHGELSLEVEDRGVGIAPEDVARLGTPFFRAERSRARAVGGRPAGGVGLGLTLARRIVEAHGGALRVHSSLGRGTTVRVTLPLVAVSAAGADTFGDKGGKGPQHGAG